MKLIILDRDGTINHDSDEYIKSPEEWKPIKGSLEGIARLTQAGYRIAVATNQSGIARGLFDTRTLFAIHDTLHARAGAGRRPHRRLLLLPARRRRRLRVPQAAAGMLLEIARRFNVPLGESDMVGDAKRDLEAAAAAGAKPVLVLTGKGAKTRDEGGCRRARGYSPTWRRSPSSSHRAVMFLRSMLFALALCLVTPPYALFCASHLSAAAHDALPPHFRLVAPGDSSCAGAYWASNGAWRGASTCRARPAVILSKHQSAWETMAFQLIFPPQVLVLKRELLWIPFFGWGLALMSPIAINRSRGMRALRTIARRGRERLAQGFWVVVFPEGTRVAPGSQREYHPGGAWLASASGAPVVPVAHNAGLLWPRNAFLKRPGTVTVRIGPPIDAANRDPKTINELARTWIEEQQKALT